MTYDWIYIGLFILHIATMTRSSGRIDWTGSDFQLFWQRKPRLSYAVWITRKGKWRNVCPVIILRRDKLSASARWFPIFGGGANKVDNNSPTSASTCDNFPRASVRKFFDVSRGRRSYLPTYRKLNFDSVYRITSQNSILNQCFHKVWQYSFIFPISSQNVTNQLTRPKRICTVWSIYFSLNCYIACF